MHKHLNITDASYKRLLALFVGSYYVINLDEAMPRVTDEDLLRTTDNIGEYYFKEHFFIQYSIICSVKGQQLSEIEDGITSPQFIDIKDKPLGSVPNILFWNDQQKQFSTQVEKMKHTLLKGDYGTGLCVILS